MTIAVILGSFFKGMKPLLAPKDNLCLFYYRDNRALAYDIGGFFCRKINNIRNELEIVKTALKEDDKVKYDPEVMEIYIWVYIWYIYIWVYIWYIYIYMSLYMIYIYEFIYDIYIWVYIWYICEFRQLSCGDVRSLVQKSAKKTCALNPILKLWS